MPQEIPIEELQQGVRAVTWERGLASVGALLASILVARLAGYLVRRAFSGPARAPAFAIGKLLTYGLVFAGCVVALGVLGIPLSSLVLTSGALLVGIGFSLQHVIRDVVAGLVILVEQSIRQHDFVSFAGTVGTVREIGLRSTQLVTPDGTALVVPNHLITTGEVTNHSHPLKRSRVHIEIPADTGESADEAGAAIMSAAENHPEVLTEPAPAVHLSAIEPAGFRFALIVWIAQPTTALRVASELRFAVSRLFAERGIRFPITAISLSTSARPGSDGSSEPEERPQP
jgi:potassium-dependent mechanosensitive channel